MSTVPILTGWLDHIRPSPRPSPSHSNTTLAPHARYAVLLHRPPTLRLYHQPDAPSPTKVIALRPETTAVTKGSAWNELVISQRDGGGGGECVLRCETQRARDGWMDAIAGVVRNAGGTAQRRALGERSMSVPHLRPPTNAPRGVEVEIPTRRHATPPPPPPPLHIASGGEGRRARRPASPNSSSLARTPDSAVSLSSTGRSLSRSPDPPRSLTEAGARRRGSENDKESVAVVGVGPGVFSSRERESEKRSLAWWKKAFRKD
ncbi:hypothetical protein HK101_002985 [Irineochytrium annulatum]|nr:hypothetical protein HK101_002985 [Irineochytrium annulatum]